MCGIAGILGEGASEEVLRSLLKPIHHRGDPEFYCEIACGKGYAIGTNRLGIVDPENGRQPFSRNGVFAIQNGEIYNVPELMGQLFPNERLATACDTEFLAVAYSRLGHAFIPQLEGMYACAFVDPSRNHWCLARDPLGIKPLYLARRGELYYFASECKALTQALVDLDSIRCLQPGEIIVCGTTLQYRMPFRFGTEAATDAESLDTVSQALRKSVKMCLPKSGTVACLLSGGIDSSTILWLAQELNEGRVEAFTFSASDTGSSEDFLAAKLVCDHLRVPLTVVTPSVDDLCDYYLEHGVSMTETFESALVRNATSYHFLCREVRNRGYKFCLSGEGADEVFGGYDYLNKLDENGREQAIRNSLEEIHRTYLQMVDRASMAATVEVRVPYMNWQFVNEAIKLPASTRIRGTQNKWSLRGISDGCLPNQIRFRRKLGMNPGAGHGSNDPSDGIYARATRRFYADQEKLASDAMLCSHFAEEYSLNLADEEEIFNFSRFVASGYQKLAGVASRPQLNTSFLSSNERLEALR